MTIDELLKELAEVRARLAKLDPKSQAYRAGKIIEANILHSLEIQDDKR